MLYSPSDFIRILLEQSKVAGFADAEILCGGGQSTELQIRKGEISQYESSATQGLSFRGVYGGQMGYAYTEILDDEALEFLLREAAENAGILDTEDYETISEGEKEYREVSSYCPELDELTFEDLSAMGLSLERKILAADERITAVDHCIVSYGGGSEMIENTKGMSLRDKSNMLFLYADTRCSQDGIVKTAGDYWVGRDIRLLDIDALAERITGKALAKLGAAPVKSGKYKVLLDGEVAADLLGAFSSIFSADMIQKGFSLLAGRMEERLAADIITIRDDAVVEGSITATAFDSEGTATQNRVLVENGILRGILHNTKTARKEGCSSTGNGFRGYKGSLSVGSKNFYIAAGDCSFDALLAELGDGLYITEVSGLHSGSNSISGDFSVSAEGFVVENGKIGRSVDQITLADNFYELLQKISHLGCDIHFNPPSGAGSLGSPALLIQESAIAGE